MPIRQQTRVVSSAVDSGGSFTNRESFRRSASGHSRWSRGQIATRVDETRRENRVCNEALLRGAWRRWFKPLSLATSFCSALVTGVATAGVFVVFAQRTSLPDATKGNLLACRCIALTCVIAAAGWWLRNAPVVCSIRGAALAALLVLVTTIVGLGQRDHGLPLRFCSALICVVTGTVSARAGALMVSVCLLWAFGSAGAERLHWLAGAEAVAALPRLMRATTLSILAPLSLAVGTLRTRLIDTHLANVQRVVCAILMADGGPVDLLLARVILASCRLDVLQVTDRHSAIDVVDAVACSPRPIELV